LRLPSLAQMFMIEARAYPSEAPFRGSRISSKGIAHKHYIRLERKGLLGANSLPY
jgi:hypothetical protein